MTAYAMKPTFGDRDGYRAWRRQWRSVYERISATIRAKKSKLKADQRAGHATGQQQKMLGLERSMAFKLMGLLEDAKGRWHRILAMQKSLDEQFAQFPVTIENCRDIDFHFNKGTLDFPMLPMWIVKAKGRSYYIHHISADAPWSTRELPEGSTRGMLRFRGCTLRIDKEGHATIERASARAILDLRKAAA